jgi:hypothetical protein
VNCEPLSVTTYQKLRWCGAALWAIEAQFRRVKNHRHLPLLKQALLTKHPAPDRIAA